MNKQEGAYYLEKEREELGYLGSNPWLLVHVNTNNNAHIVFQTI